MKPLIPITIPLLNPNEPEALLASLEVLEGEPIKRDDVVALIETTKSTGEVQAGADGFLVGLRFKEGDTLRAGEVLAYVGATPTAQDLSLPPWAVDQAVQRNANKESDGLRITLPARELALEKGLDLDTLPHGPLVTRQTIREMLASRSPAQAREIPEDENRIVIYGAGGHGRSLAALIRLLDSFEMIGFLDDGYDVGEGVLGLALLGGSEKLDELAEDGILLAVNGVGGIGDLQPRLRVFNLLRQAGFTCPTVVHPSAFLEESVTLGDGIQVFPYAYVGTEVQVGYGTIINTGAIVSHNCVLGQYVNLSPGATLAGDVTVCEGALIGMRATVNLNVQVGKRARIGNGATIKSDVPDGGVVPAGTIWPPRR